MTGILHSGESPYSYAPHRGSARSGRVGSPLEWMRGRREERTRRRAEAQVSRVVQRVELLGPHWRILDPNPADPDFIAIGPGGIFSVTICDHGREKVMLAGEVVQVEGRRPPYIAKARQEADRVSAGLTRAAGRRVPVIPVIAFLGTGEIIYYGKPPEGCVVTTYRDLSRALDAHGNRLTPHTIDKLCLLAERPDTWMNQQIPDASAYRWYPADTTVADKRAQRG